jgi:hypothetical protein
MQVVLMTKYCSRCSYPLDYLPENRCPECGQAFDPEDPESFRTVPVNARSRTAWILSAYTGALSLNFSFWIVISMKHGAGLLAGVELFLWSICGPFAWLLKPKQSAFPNTPISSIIGVAMWGIWLFCVCKVDRLKNAPLTVHLLASFLALQQNLWVELGLRPRPRDF